MPVNTFMHIKEITDAHWWGWLPLEKVENGEGKLGDEMGHTVLASILLYFESVTMRKYS